MIAQATLPGPHITDDTLATVARVAADIARSVIMLNAAAVLDYATKQDLPIPDDVRHILTAHADYRAALLAPELLAAAKPAPKPGAKPRRRKPGPVR